MNNYFKYHWYVVRKASNKIWLLVIDIVNKKKITSPKKIKLILCDWFWALGWMWWVAYAISKEEFNKMAFGLCGLNPKEGGSGFKWVKNGFINFRNENGF